MPKHGGWFEAYVATETAPDFLLLRYFFLWRTRHTFLNRSARHPC